MKRFASLFMLGACSVQGLTAAEMPPASNRLECTVVEEHDKIIRCTFSSVRIASDRNVTFSWKSETTPQDDRERTFVLPAGHGSVYDYRYYYGRAQGTWQISILGDDGETLAKTSFTID